jgi:hypothetical protein
MLVKSPHAKFLRGFHNIHFCRFLDLKKCRKSPRIRLFDPLALQIRFLRLQEVVARTHIRLGNTFYPGSKGVYGGRMVGATHFRKISEIRLFLFPWMQFWSPTAKTSFYGRLVMCRYVSSHRIQYFDVFSRFYAKKVDFWPFSTPPKSRFGTSFERLDEYAPLTTFVF